MIGAPFLASCAQLLAGGKSEGGLFGRAVSHSVCSLARVSALRAAHIIMPDFHSRSKNDDADIDRQRPKIQFNSMMIAYAFKLIR